MRSILFHPEEAEAKLFPFFFHIHRGVGTGKEKWIPYDKIIATGSKVTTESDEFHFALHLKES